MTSSTGSGCQVLKNKLFPIGSITQRLIHKLAGIWKCLENKKNKYLIISDIILKKNNKCK